MPGPLRNYSAPTKKKRMVGLDSTSFPFFCGARLFFRGNPCFKCQFCSEFIGVELAQPIPKTSTSAEDQNQGPEREQLQMCRHKKAPTAVRNKRPSSFQNGCDLKQLFFCSRKIWPVFWQLFGQHGFLLKILWKVLKEPFLGG